ncbi:MAG: RNA polymerase subunit sigma-70 [Planctomycetaceae bacterium]|nr:RNA polymerase subunit sigma-70 [Planctomycetaceae bacterium]
MPHPPAMLPNYKIQPIKELRDQQVRYAPREKKIEQLERAEKLYREIDTKKNYSYKSICYLITEYRPEMYADLLFPGKDVKGDLLRFIDDLADSVVISPEQVKETIWTIEQLCERFNVSSKTILRWRKLGLFSRRFLVDGKKRVGFLNDSVEYFAANHPELIRRGKHFSQLAQEERDAIIDQAKKMMAETSAARKTPTAIARQLAKSTGRSVETIRYTLKAFDDANADNAIFPKRHTPFSEEVKQKIYQDFRHGETVESLARRYDRTLTGIYNILGACRFRQVMDLPLDYVDASEFHSAETKFKTITAKKIEEDIVGSEVFVETKNPNGSAEREMDLFRKMNYLKYQANRLRMTLDRKRPKVREMAQIEEFYDQAVRIKNEIIAANSHLVASVARQHVSPTADFSELVNDGNLVLMKAVEEFDYSRGSKFSTYATWAMMKYFAQSVPNEKKHLETL